MLIVIEDSGRLYPTLVESIVLTTAFAAGFGLYICYVRNTITNPFGIYAHFQIFELILSRLEVYVVSIREVCTQISDSIPLDVIPSLSVISAISILGWLGPLIETHEMVLTPLIRIVQFLDGMNSPLFQPFNVLLEEMRDRGNFMLEIYRALENHIGIPVSHSRITLLSFEI